MNEETNPAGGPPNPPPRPPAQPANRPRLIAPPRPPGPPKVPPKPSKLKKHLMLWIIILIGIFGGLHVIRLVYKDKGGVIGFFKMVLGVKDEKVINVKQEVEDAIEEGRSARRAIDDLEIKVWSKGKKLSAAEFAEIKKQRDALEDCIKKFDDLMARIREEQKKGKLRSGETEEEGMIGPEDLKIKLWILDADDLLRTEKDDKAPAGLYIRMEQTVRACRKAQEELKEIEITKADILKDPAKKAETLKKLSQLQEVFGKAGQMFSDLDDYVRKGLARDNLTSRQLPELERMGEEGQSTNMAIKAIRDLKNYLKD